MIKCFIACVECGFVKRSRFGGMKRECGDLFLQSISLLLFDNAFKVFTFDDSRFTQLTYGLVKRSRFIGMKRQCGDSSFNLFDCRF